jgi:multidrug efflux pump subunit AcrA (membrane-fusion protein)
MRYLILLTAIVVVIAACSSGEENKAELSQNVVKVKTMVVNSEMVKSARSFAGNVSSNRTAMIIPKVSGYIESISVNPGDKVSAGQVLVTLKSPELQEKAAFAKSAVDEAGNGLKQAQIGYRMAVSKKNQASSQFELAEKTYNRYKNLIAEESVSKQEYDQVKAKYQSASEAKKIAEDNVALAEEKISQLKYKKRQAISMSGEVRTYLEYTKIKAPFDGVVLERLMDIGNLAAPASAVLKLGDLVPVIYTHVTESLINDVKVGNFAKVEIESAELEYDAKILEVSPDIDAASRSFKVKLMGSKSLVAGMYAKVYFPVGTSDTLVVPKSAVIKRGQLTVVFVKNGQKADMRMVKVGRTINDKVEVLSGLNNGDVIVVENATTLRTGDKLE